MSKRPLVAARQDGVDAFPGADLMGKVDRPVGQRLISGRAQSYSIKTPLPAIVADNTWDQCLFPFAAETSVPEDVSV